MKNFLKFTAVGTLGFLADAGVLWIGLHVLRLDPYSGRVISFLCAATVTWIGNRWFTFRDRRHHHPARQWAAFVTVSALAFIPNYGTYALLVAYVPLVRHWPFANWPVLAVAAGSIAGLFFNFAAASKLIFPRLEKEPQRPI